MDPNIPSAEAEVTQSQSPSGFKTDPSGAISPAKPPATDRPWQEWIEPASEFLGKLPDLVKKFFSDFKEPLTVVALLLGGLVTVYLTLALLDAINDIPLLAPVFELVGIGFGIWFIWRYLWSSKGRQELFQEFQSLKEQVLGSDVKE
ncbi:MULTISPECIES: CAAD domain-containing protein [Spirulina sp. CCY15215]|uniref:CAAD domain-containing protein n=1 Tax=Spirulina sp. CCY15215 TaxID=2767591 RepID=UPI001950AB31|nr:CAAD domain-containing protein [Spirulina major]